MFENIDHSLYDFEFEIQKSYFLRDCLKKDFHFETSSSHYDKVDIYRVVDEKTKYDNKITELGRMSADDNGRILSRQFILLINKEVPLYKKQIKNNLMKIKKGLSELIIQKEMILSTLSRDDKLIYDTNISNMKKEFETENHILNVVECFTKLFGNIENLEKAVSNMTFILDYDSEYSK